MLSRHKGARVSVKGAFDTAKQLLPKQASDHFAINEQFHDTRGQALASKAASTEVSEEGEHTTTLKAVCARKEVTNNFLASQKLVAPRVQACCAAQSYVRSQMAAPGRSKSHDLAARHLAGQQFYLFRH